MEWRNGVVAQIEERHGYMEGWTKFGLLACGFTFIRYINNQINAFLLSYYSSVIEPDSSINRFNNASILIIIYKWNIDYLYPIHIDF